MKRVLLSASGIFLLALIIVLTAGCVETPPPPGEETSTCVECHSDKEMLKQTATVVEEVTSEETTGEG